MTQKLLEKNISITLKQQIMIDEISKNNYEINLSSVVRIEIERDSTDNLEWVKLQLYKKQSCYGVNNSW